MGEGASQANAAPTKPFFKYRKKGGACGSHHTTDCCSQMLFVWLCVSHDYPLLLAAQTPPYRYSTAIYGWQHVLATTIAAAATAARHCSTALLYSSSVESDMVPIVLPSRGERRQPSRDANHTLLPYIHTYDKNTPNNTRPAFSRVFPSTQARLRARQLRLIVRLRLISEKGENKAHPDRHHHKAKVISVRNLGIRRGRPHRVVVGAQGKTLPSPALLLSSGLYFNLIYFAAEGAPLMENCPWGTNGAWEGAGYHRPPRARATQQRL